MKKADTTRSTLKSGVRKPQNKIDEMKSIFADLDDLNSKDLLVCPDARWLLLSA
jgi:hypothetical protein